MIKRILFSAVVFCTILTKADNVPKLKPEIFNGLSIKTSPSQFIGLRFPIIVEKGYGGWYSAEIGIGPTWGKKSLVLTSCALCLQCDECHSGFYETYEKRRLGFHFQAQQRIYVKKDVYNGSYFSLFYRYGYFNTTLDEVTFLKKNQFFFLYGYKFLHGKENSEIWIGAGFSQLYTRYYDLNYFYEPGASAESDYVGRYSRLRASAVVPSVVVGFNLGLNLD